MNTILTDDEFPPLRPQDHPEPHSFAWTEQEMRAIRARDRLVEAAVLAKLREQEPVVEFMGRRQTPEGTRECWGVLLCDFMQDPAKGTKLYIHPPTSLAESPKQWRSVMPGGKLTDKWDSARVADYNQGWNDYRKAALRNLESAAPLPAVVQVPRDELLSLLQRARLYTNGVCVHVERAPFAVFRSDLDAAIAALEKQ